MGIQWSCKNDWRRDLVTFINVWFCVDVVFNLALYVEARMTGNKRFKNVEEKLYWGTVQYFTYNDEKITDEEIEKLVNHLLNQNEKLKKDATTLIYANQDYRQQNQNLQKQLDYIQNSITNAIKHQKTELGQKALQEIIADYNEWMLGHNGVKE